VVNHTPFNSVQMSPKPAQIVNRASASPSISSLVDPPNQPTSPSSLAAQSFFSMQTQMKMQNHEGPTSVPPSPTVNKAAPSPILVPSQVTVAQQAPAKTEQQQPEQWVRAPAPAPTFASSNAQQGHFSTIGSTKKSTPNAVGSTATSSAAPSPKPPKVIDISPPPLPGSGSISMFGNGPKDGTESRAPTIVLNIPMNGENNKYINFGRLAEERYGWEALHPRLAAQRERLARVAAAGAALEKSSMNKESGDEMSLDLSEGEGSNVEMGGMSDGRTGTDNGAKKPVRKRKMKEDEYDKDDGFVDDTELLWEEQAAASKDGFFVYSGPLVPEGEKPLLERFVNILHITSILILTNSAEKVVHQSVAADVGVVALPVAQLVLAVAALLEKVVAEEEDQVLEVGKLFASRASPKPTAHAWRMTRGNERCKAPWQLNPVAMELCLNSQVLRAWAVLR
jgi:hypothetical protein